MGSMKSNNIKTRNHKLDAVKMFLIICVIFAHVPLLNGFLDIGLPEKYDLITKVSVRGIYAFHMPLFVLLSGYFTKKKALKEQFRGSLKLIKLFLIFHVVDLVITAYAYEKLPSISDIFYPSFALWYLLCLFYWRLLISALPGNWEPKWILLAAIFLSLAIGFTPIRGHLGLHRFFSFMPYFIIGHYYGRNVLNFIENKLVTALTPPLWKITIVLIFLSIMAVSALNPYWLDVIISPYKNNWGIFFRMSYLAYSLILSGLLLAIFSFIKEWRDNVFSHYGSDTMLFYVIHPYILYGIVRLWCHFTNAINIIDTLLITMLTTSILAVIEKTKTIYSLHKR